MVISSGNLCGSSWEERNPDSAANSWAEGRKYLGSAVVTLCNVCAAHWEHITSCASLCVLPVREKGLCRSLSSLPDVLLLQALPWFSSRNRLISYHWKALGPLLESTGICGLLLKVHSWLQCLLQFYCSTHSECLHTQHTMEEVTQERQNSQKVLRVILVSRSCSERTNLRLYLHSSHSPYNSACTLWCGQGEHLLDHGPWTMGGRSVKGRR